MTFRMLFSFILTKFGKDSRINIPTWIKNWFYKDKIKISEGLDEYAFSLREDDIDWSLKEI